MEKGFKDVWASLRRSKTGMVGLILVLIIIFCAIFAHVLAPCDPMEQNLMNKLADPIWGRRPSRGTCLAPTSWAATSSPGCCTAPG